jgi:cytochrome bd-type quinol oxidase subunit 2
MIENIWLVYLGLGLVLIVIVAGALVLWTTTSGDFETSRLRYAAATSTGLFVILIFVTILYFVNPTGAGKDIFEKAFTPLVALAGAIIGSFFGREKKG